MKNALVLICVLAFILLQSCKKCDCDDKKLGELKLRNTSEKWAGFNGDEQLKFMRLPDSAIFTFTGRGYDEIENRTGKLVENNCGAQCEEYYSFPLKRLIYAADSKDNPIVSLGYALTKNTSGRLDDPPLNNIPPDSIEDILFIYIDRGGMYLPLGDYPIRTGHPNNINYYEQAEIGGKLYDSVYYLSFAPEDVVPGQPVSIYYSFAEGLISFAYEDGTQWVKQ